MSIKTRAIRPDIHNTYRRQRINVLNTAGKVSLAGYCQHSLWSQLFNSLPCQCPSSNYEKMKAYFLGHSHQSANITAAAALAIIRVPGNFMRTAVKLQAMRSHHQQSVWRYFKMSLPNNLIADRYKGSLYFTLILAKQLSQQHHHRKQRINHIPDMTAQKRWHRPSLNSSCNADNAYSQKKQCYRQKSAYYSGQVFMYFC